MNRDIKLLFEAYNSIKEAEDTNIDTFHKELAKQWASLFLDKLHEYPITSRSAHLERLLDGSLEVFKKYILDDIKSKKLSYLEADAFSKSEDTQGLSDQEYHQARKFGLESAGEVVGKGPIKIQLTKDQTLLCTRDGREQEVKFVKGVIFNCDEWVGDYYHCESKKYGGVAVFPPDIKLLSAPEGTITHLTPE